MVPAPGGKVIPAPGGKVPASRAADPSSNLTFLEGLSFFFNLSHPNIGAPVITLPGALPYSVSDGSGWPSVSILRPGELAIMIGNCCLCVVDFVLEIY